MGERENSEGLSFGFVPGEKKNHGQFLGVFCCRLAFAGRA
jgi:hypothetical protein